MAEEASLSRLGRGVAGKALEANLDAVAIQSGAAIALTIEKYAGLSTAASFIGD